MENPADSVVDCFRLGEGLMSTLVSDNPNAGGEQTCPEAVQRPEGDSRGSVQVWVWQRDNGRIDEGFNVGGGLVDAPDHEQVPKALLLLLLARQATKRQLVKRTCRPTTSMQNAESSEH